MEKTSRKVRVSKTKKANLGRVVTIAVSEEGLLIPRDILEGAQEVEIRREHETIRILPIVPRDSIFQLGSQPVHCNLPDASVNHDQYIYGAGK